MSGSIALNTTMGGSVLLVAENTATPATVNIPAKNNSTFVVTNSAGQTEIGSQGIVFEDGSVLDSGNGPKYTLDATITNLNTQGAIAIDLSLASIFNLNLSGNVTSVQLTNTPALLGRTLSFVVKIKQGATAYALTWFPGITWLTTNGTAPAAPAANKTTEYIFTSTSLGVYEGRKGAST
jgi:hypothetical protein